MLGIKVDVTPPLTRDDGAPLTLSELAGWQIYTQIEGASTWSPIGGLNGTDVLTRTIGNVPEGTVLNVRTSWVDTQTPPKEGTFRQGQILAQLPAGTLAPPGQGGMVLTVVPQ